MTQQTARRPVRPGVVSPKRPVRAGIVRPEYVGKEKPDSEPWPGGDVKDAATIERIRRASRVAAQAVQAVGQAVRPGITTDELDAIGHQFLTDAGAYPSTLGYRGFPKSLCTSVNEVICHGIPDSRQLDDGDIVNIDVTAFLDGVHGDTNATFAVGDVAGDVLDLVERTAEATRRGIAAVKPGRSINVIGRVISAYARRFGYGVVREYTGHGVAEAFHSGLVIPHYDAAPLYDQPIEVGMVFTVEPMLTLGGAQWDIWEDGWTVVTSDGSMSAQFEHTIAVTEHGAEVLTLP